MNVGVAGNDIPAELLDPARAVAEVRVPGAEPWRREGRRFVFGTAENAHA